MNKFKHHHIILLSVTLILVGFIVLCRFEPNIAEWYTCTIYPGIATGLSFISSLVPFSLFDVFIAIVVLLFIVGIVLLILRKIKLRRWLFLVVASIIGIVIWFYMAWGTNYFRHDFYARTLVPKVTFDSVNFRHFLAQYIDELNNSYVPSLVDLDYTKIDRDIEASYRQLHQQLHLPYPCGKRRMKQMTYEKWMTKTGVSGYFGPFFNEVHVNNHLLPTEKPSVMAHEKAHQLGIASEAECNLYAYIVCTASVNPQVRYSGYFEALGYVLSGIHKLLPKEEYKQWVAKIDIRIINDYNAARENWQKAINQTMAEAQRKVYDGYLKTNNIKSGVENYSEMLALLVSWYNQQ